MSYLRTLFVLLLVLFLVSLLYVKHQPNSFVIQRSILTTVPTATLYNYIAKVENWHEWNHLTQDSLNTKTTLFGFPINNPLPKWKNPNENIKTIESEEPKKIVQQINSEGAKLSTVTWNIIDSGELQWVMEGSLNFWDKAFISFSGGIDTLLGRHYQKKMHVIDSLISFRLNEHRFELKKKDTLSPYFYLALTYQTDRFAMDTLWEKGKQILLSYAKEQQMEVSGKAFTTYPRITPEIIRWRVGVPLSRYYEVTHPYIRCLYIRNRPNIKGVHYGTYDTLQLSWEKLQSALDTINPARSFAPIKRYLVGPEDNPDPLTWRTELIIPYE